MPGGCARRIPSPATPSSTCRRTSSSIARASRSTSIAAPTAPSTRAPINAGASTSGRRASRTKRWSARSLAIHAEYYRLLAQLLDGIADRHGRFLLIDVHSYNHRRDGPDAPPTPQEAAPDINIGTFSMPREHWAFLVDPLIDAMRGFDFNGRRLDVRENVAFQGRGEQTRFVHERYPQTGCAIALEIKKFYMDEWTGAPDPAALAAMRALIAHVAGTAEEIVSR